MFGGPLFVQDEDVAASDGQSFERDSLSTGKVVSVAAASTVANSPSVSGTLIAHPAIRRVDFTGSARAGGAIAQTPAQCLKPVLLELGSKTPLIVFDDPAATSNAPSMSPAGSNPAFATSIARPCRTRPGCRLVVSRLQATAAPAEARRSMSLPDCVGSR